MEPSKQPFFKPPLYEAPPPKDPHATALTAPAFNAESENEDEWEYEYSATETETYYLTLDLTVQDLRPKRKGRALRERNKKLKWLDPAMTKNFQSMEERKLRAKLAGSQGNPHRSVDEAGGENEGEGTQSPEDDEDGENGLEDPWDEGSNYPEEPMGALGSKKPDKFPTSVQIMQLHSDNPIVSYGHQFYSCEWVSNIGTEMLFMPHDAENPLPALRNLPGNIDLLAASSARIVSTPLYKIDDKTLRKIKKRELKRLGQSGRPPRGKVKGLKVYVSLSAPNARKEQAIFLEKMIKAKKKLKQRDNVTVNAAARKTHWKWGAQIGRERRARKKRLLRLIAKGGEEGEDAEDEMVELEKAEATRLEEMGERARRESLEPKRKRKANDIEEDEDQDEEISDEEPVPKRRRGRPPKRVPRATDEGARVTPEPSSPPSEQDSPRIKRYIYDEDMEDSSIESDEEDDSSGESGGELEMYEDANGMRYYEDAYGRQYFDDESESDEQDESDEADQEDQDDQVTEDEEEIDSDDSSDQHDSYDEDEEDGLHDEDAPGEEDDTHYA